MCEGLPDVPGQPLVRRRRFAAQEGRRAGNPQRVAAGGKIALPVQCLDADAVRRLAGSITPGKRADFAILSANPLKVPPADIRTITVLETVKDGDSVYKAVP